MIKQSFSDNIVDFLKDYTAFYPFKISHILIANRVVFTDKLVIKEKQISGNHKFDKLYSLGEMKYHLTQLVTSKTNDTVKQANGIIKNTTVKVRTPYKALEYWYNLKPDFFIREHWYVSRNGV
jgi:hypothetical protein